MSAVPPWSSTSAKIHPNITSLLQPMPRRSPMKWISSIAGLSIAGVAGKLYIDNVRERRARLLEAKYQEEAERQRRSEKLLDVYGDRENLDGLQKAVQFYESSDKKKD